jgi:uncharacterized protein YxeA
MYEGAKLNSHMSQKISKTYKLFFLVILFLPCLYIINNTMDNDVWFLLNSGKYVFAHGIPYTEPFTIHQGFSFVMQQWLSACIFWLVYSNLGFFGLIALNVLCYGLTIYFVYLICLRVSQNHFFVSLLVSLLSSFMIIPLITIRPGLLSTFIFVVELYFLEGYMAERKIKYLLPLPILSILLINLHAAMWPMIFVLTLPFLAESVTFRFGKFHNIGFPKHGLLSIIGFMFLGGFANPYGWNGMTYLFKSFGYQEINQFVGEMRAPEINSFFGAVLYGGLLIVILTYLLYQKGTTTIRFVFLSLGTAYLALSAIRSIPLFVIGGIYPLAFYLKNIKLPLPQETSVTPKTIQLRKILIVSTLTLMIICFGITALSHDTGNQDIQLLRSTLQFIQNENRTKDVVLYTSYDEGGFAEYVGFPVYIDTRAEVFVKANNKKEDVMKEYFDLQMGYSYCKDFLDKYQFTHLLVTKKDILYIYLSHDKEYKLTYSNTKYYLFEKNI